MKKWPKFEVSKPAWADGKFVDERCPECSAEEEVGAVVLTDDGRIACEGCRRAEINKVPPAVPKEPDVDQG